MILHNQGTGVVQAVPDRARGGLVETTARGIRRWQIAFIVVIGVGIASCVWVFAYQNVAYGVVIALGLAIIIYLMLSFVHLDHRITNCAESLTLIPLYIVFTSSLPWFFINQQYLLPAVYSCILALCLWHVYQKKLSLRELFGYSKDKLLKYSLIGLGIGVPLGMGEYLILHPVPVSSSFEVRYLFRDMAYMLLFVGIAEELLFRGFIQRDMTEAFGWKWALFGTSSIFAIIHLT